MRIVRACIKWIIFIVLGYFGTITVLAIATYLPLFLGYWIYPLSNFWFCIVGSLLLGLYYSLLYVGLGSFYIFLEKKKPDYWFSNIFLSTISVLFFYAVLTKLGIVTNLLVSELPSKEILNFKFITFFLVLLPAYLQILYISVLAPFLKYNDRNSS